MLQCRTPKNAHGPSAENVSPVSQCQISVVGKDSTVWAPLLALAAWTEPSRSPQCSCMCKEYISNYRKWLRKLCIYSTSDEDNKHDTNYTNKHKYTNIDTRELHQ